MTQRPPRRIVVPAKFKDYTYVSSSSEEIDLDTRNRSIPSMSNSFATLRSALETMKDKSFEPIESFACPVSQTQEMSQIDKQIGTDTGQASYQDWQTPSVPSILQGQPGNSSTLVGDNHFRANQIVVENDKRRQAADKLSPTEQVELDAEPLRQAMPEQWNGERRRTAEFEEEKRRQAELEEEKRRQAELEEEKRLLAKHGEAIHRQAELEEERRRQAEIEEAECWQAKHTEEKRREVELEEKRLQAEYEETRRRQAELEEEKRRQAEIEEAKRRQAKHEEEKRREAELEEEKRREEKLEEEKRRQSELQEKRLQAEHEETKRQQAQHEEERRRRVEQEQINADRLHQAGLRDLDSEILAADLAVNSHLQRNNGIIDLNLHAYRDPRNGHGLGANHQRINAPAPHNMDLIAQLLHAIRDDQRDNHQLYVNEFRQLSRRIDRVVHAMNRASEFPRKPDYFPVRTVQDIAALPNPETDLEEFNKEVDYLADLGGYNLSECCNLMVKHAIEDSLSPSLTWQGREPGTLKLKDTNLAEAFHSATGMNRAFQKPNMREFTDAMTAALKASKQRNRNAILRQRVAAVTRRPREDRDDVGNANHQRRHIEDNIPPQGNADM